MNKTKYLLLGLLAISELICIFLIDNWKISLFIVLPIVFICTLIIILWKEEGYDELQEKTA